MGSSASERYFESAQMSKWIADMRDKIIEENDKNDKDVNKRKKDNSQGERKKIKRRDSGSEATQGISRQ